MKTIERYVFGAFLTSFFLAFLVLSFVLTVGLMVQIVGYMLQGIPVDLVARFALVSFPETMQWTIPIALLVSSILVFSRMSADSEVAAMRACGVNLFTVTRWPLLFAVGCTVLGVFVNNEIVPRGHQVRRDLTRRISVGAGLELLEPGRVIDDFPKVKIYFEEKEGNWLKDLIVLDFSNPKVDRMVTAAKALVTSEGRDVVLDLHGMTVDPLDERNPGMARAARFQYRVKDALKDRTYKRKVKDFRFLEMMDQIREAKSDVKNPEVAAARKAKERLEKDDGRERTEKKDSVAKELKLGKKVFKRHLSELRTEFQKRMVFAFASICFVLVGIPLGIRAQRKESSIGMAIALVVALSYYLVVILMTSMDKSYAVRPDLLIWLPVVLCAALASYLIPKNL
ncbi:MAG: LptF/LptG family permease [bacterium]|nr:LptF/LptG family permease [bacterium]